MDPETIEGTVELSATVDNLERCWPSHHDYQQARETDPALMFCRLCGDVLELKLPEETR